MFLEWNQNIYALVITTAIATMIGAKVIQLFPNCSSVKVSLLTFCLVLNPYVYSLLTKDIFDSTQQLSLILALLYSNSMTQYQYLLLGVATGINPANLPLSIFLLQSGVPNQKRVVLLLSGVLISTLVISGGDYAKLLNNYKDQFFPQSFSIQFNMVWGMLAHMFDRYIALYQFVFIFVNFASLYLINHLTLAKTVKIMVLLFIKQYCSYHCSEFSLFSSLLIQAFLVARYLPDLVQKLQIQTKTFEIGKIQILGIVWAVVALSFFIFNKLLVQKYYNDFTINTGYLQIYITLIWAVRAVFLSQLITTSVTVQKDWKTNASFSTQSVDSSSQLKQE